MVEEGGHRAVTMLVAVLIAENGSVKIELLWIRSQKTKDIIKAIEIMEENGPIRKIEHKCQVSHKIQFFLLMMELERSKTCRGYK
jgi:hypothetical protein